CLDDVTACLVHGRDQRNGGQRIEGVNGDRYPDLLADEVERVGLQQGLRDLCVLGSRRIFPLLTVGGFEEVGEVEAVPLIDENVGLVLVLVEALCAESRQGAFRQQVEQRSGRRCRGGRCDQQRDAK